MADKIFYSMGEVCEMFDVNSSLIRFWEEKFPAIKSKRNSRGHRIYTPEQLETIRLVYHLVKENGMTLAGAAKRMKQNRGSIKRDANIVSRLGSIRAMLLEIREDLDDGTRTVVEFDDQATEPQAVANTAQGQPSATEGSTQKPSTAKRGKKRELKPKSEQFFDVAPKAEQPTQEQVSEADTLPEQTTLDELNAIQATQAEAAAPQPSEQSAEPQPATKRSEQPKPHIVEQTLF